MSIKTKINGKWVVQAGSSTSAGVSAIGAVLYDSAQSLTASEKSLARSNIGAISASDIPTSTSELKNDSNFLSGTDVTLTKSAQAADARVVGTKIGDMNTLNTVDKSTLVSAINEVLASITTKYTYGTEDLVAGESALKTGELYFVYE